MKCVDAREPPVKVMLLAVRHVYAVGDVLFGGAVDVLPVERHEERGCEQHEREDEAREEEAVPRDPQQRVVDDGAARRVAAEVRVLDELDRGDEVHGPARVRLDLVAERGVVLHVGVELRALALLHEPHLVLAALLLDDERVVVQLPAREHEAGEPEGEREQRDVEEAVGDESRVASCSEHESWIGVTNMKLVNFKKYRLVWKSIYEYVFSWYAMEEIPCIQWKPGQAGPIQRHQPHTKYIRTKHVWTKPIRTK